jgi:hypothetical protein
MRGEIGTPNHEVVLSKRSLIITTKNGSSTTALVVEIVGEIL